MGQTSERTTKLTEYDPYKRWGKVIDLGSVIIDDKLIFYPTEGGTRFNMVYDVEWVILKVLSSMIISLMRKQMKLDLGYLKSILEAQT